METKFHDINQLPQEEGLLFFGISMSRIGNAQSAAQYIDYIKHLGTKIGKTDGVGAVFVYADYLYFHSNEPAVKLMTRYANLMLNHKMAFLNALFKDDKAWIKKAFSFSTFGQLLLDNAEVFKKTHQVVMDMYKNDSEFRGCVDKDVQKAGRAEGEGGVDFILEEITIFYLLAKGELVFNNEFVSGTEQWVLQCYPGTPLISEVYLFQKNPLKLSNPKNKFENHFYDLEEKVLYDYTKLDINTFQF